MEEKLTYAERLSNLERLITDNPDQVATIKALCQSVFEGVANFQEELILFKMELQNLKNLLTEVIIWVKKLHGYKIN